MAQQNAWMTSAEARLVPLCLAVVLLAGSCGGSSKLSSQETAAWLMRRQTDKGAHVICRVGRGKWSDWDYACTMNGPGVTGSPAENTYGFNVDGRGVTTFSG